MTTGCFTWRATVSTPFEEKKGVSDYGGCTVKGQRRAYVGCDRGGGRAPHTRRGETWQGKFKGEQDIPTRRRKKKETNSLRKVHRLITL